MCQVLFQVHYEKTNHLILKIDLTWLNPQNLQDEEIEVPRGSNS